MAISTVHFLHGIRLPGAQFIAQLTDTTPTQNTEELVGYAAGHHEPLFRGIRSQQPEVTFRSPQLKTILDVVAAGNVYGADLSGGNTDLYMRLGTDFGVRGAPASTVHKILRMAQSYLALQSLSLRHQQDAELACRVVPTWNGSVAPIVSVGTSALAGTAAVDAFFTLGPVKINGSVLPGVQSVEVDFGVDLLIAGDNGEGWPTFVGIRQTNTVLTVSGLEVQPWLDYGLVGSAAVPVVWYARKKDPAGINVADATAQHISFTGVGKVMVDQSSQGDNRESNTQVRIGLVAPDSSTPALAFNTAVAIT